MCRQHGVVADTTERFHRRVPEIKTMLRTCAFYLYGWLCEHAKKCYGTGAVHPIWNDTSCLSEELARTGPGESAPKGNSTLYIVNDGGNQKAEGEHQEVCSLIRASRHIFLATRCEKCSHSGRSTYSLREPQPQRE